jgi:phosphoribosylglycinamide formyltransferase-1
LGLNLCVLASGSGSNLKAIIKAQKAGKISSKVVLVISNNSVSGAINIANEYQIPAVHLSQKLFKTQSEFDKKLLALLKKFKIDLIILAGYMKKISPALIKKFKNKILNIHPALLPLFGGKGMYGIFIHQAVLNSGAKLSGASVHIVDDKYDNGPIVLQKSIPVKDDDTPESLQKRILKLEHKLYPEAIKLFETKKVMVKDNKINFR